MIRDWWKPLLERPSITFSRTFEPQTSQAVDLDEVLVLEAKVFSAMARLQKSAYNGPECEGIDHCQIVDFLTERYSLDGDVESQVITALRSGIKKGFICCLRNGNYSLAGPATNKMIAQCFNTVPHGPQCSCFLINTGKRRCCSFRFNFREGFVRKMSCKLGKKKLMRGSRLVPKRSKQFGACPDKCLHSPVSTSTSSDACISSEVVNY